MDATSKIHLTEEKETPPTTPHAKALDYRSRHSILQDKAADDILKKIYLDLTKDKGFRSSVAVIRAKQFDEWIKEFIRENQNA